MRAFCRDSLLVDSCGSICDIVRHLCRLFGGAKQANKQSSVSGGDPSDGMTQQQQQQQHYHNLTPNLASLGRAASTPELTTSSSSSLAQYYSRRHTTNKLQRLFPSLGSWSKLKDAAESRQQHRQKFSPQQLRSLLVVGATAILASGRRSPAPPAAGVIAGTVTVTATPKLRDHMHCAYENPHENEYDE